MKNEITYVKDENNKTFSTYRDIPGRKIDKMISEINKNDIKLLAGSSFESEDEIIMHYKSKGYKHVENILKQVIE